jgi:hypothetical protein
MEVLLAEFGNHRDLTPNLGTHTALTMDTLQTHRTAATLAPTHVEAVIRIGCCITALMVVVRLTCMYTVLAVRMFTTNTLKD